MNLEMVLNELSLRTLASDEQTARQLMSELIGTVRQATVSGVQRVLRISDDIKSVELAPGYPIVRWCNDHKVDREERQFFLTLTTKTPLWTDTAKEIKDDFDLSDVFHQGEIAIGLGFALIIDALPVSIKSQSRWDCSRLELELTRLEDEDLIEENLEIVHASRKHHVQEHTEWIKNRIRKEVEVCDGSDLWNSRNKLFPSLEFCSDVCKQMQILGSGNPMLRQVVKRLFELEEYCKSWTDGVFELERLPCKASPESETRLQQFRQQLTLKCPDGEKRIFSLHVRMTPAAWRLYFSVELGPGKIIIGYIGPKIH